MALGNDRGFSLAETLVVTAIMVVALGVVTGLFVQGNRMYAQQRDYADVRSNTAAVLDMTVRLLRGAQTITVDPDGNNAADSVRVVSDWNPRDGDTNDAYENVTFTAAGGTFFKREPTDAAPVAFAERIASVAFTYRNGMGALIATPWTAAQSNLAHVTVTVTSTPINGAQIVMSSSASVRRRE